MYEKGQWAERWCSLALSRSETVPWVRVLNRTRGDSWTIEREMPVSPVLEEPQGSWLGDPRGLFPHRAAALLWESQDFQGCFLAVANIESLRI